jgi:hypothetical protein
LAVPATGPLTLAAARPPRVLALTAGAAAIRTPKVSPATASRVGIRHRAQVMNIQVSLHG